MLLPAASLPLSTALDSPHHLFLQRISLSVRYASDHLQDAEDEVVKEGVMISTLMKLPNTLIPHMWKKTRQKTTYPLHAKLKEIVTLTLPRHSPTPVTSF